MFTLVTKARHTWGPQRRVAACMTPTGHEQIEWTCIKCPMVRITVMPAGADARREWRHGNGSQFIDVAMPECRGVEQPKEQEGAA